MKVEPKNLILAIDLGASHSSVAVAEALSGDGFYSLPELPGYSVIADRFCRRITPSVVAEDDKGNIVVGHAAKARAGRSPEPIMFAKRSMGEDVTFQLKQQGTLSPVDVSAHILRYLKEMAEQQLGEKVTQAIITVPAYFALKATQMTNEAAARAGLEVLQILPEPVAAALMYCASDPRESIRVMTYDLGGGTFDVAILEKINGRISVESIKAFDGDRFLGGYNFDRAIAFWLIDRLKDQGFDLDLNHDDPADRVIFAKILIYAERAKMELSKADASEIVEPSTGFEDHSGNPVAIELTLSRAEFEAMIAKDVERTIDLCHLAICAAADSDKKPEPRSSNEIPEVERLDEILMVGGSSRIPAISRRLEIEFRRTPKLLEPDLCVALGAAVLAGSRKKTVVANCIELDSLPTSSPVPFIQLTGTARPEGTGPSSCQLILRSLDGGFRKALQLPEDGRFAFTGVPINRSATTDFAIELKDPSGGDLGSHRFSVSHVDQLTAGATTSTKAVVVSGTRTNFLAKPIRVAWRDSTEVIAPKGTPLPFDCKIVAHTSDKSGEIRISIKEENTPLGEIIMTELPDTLPIGTELEVSLEITENSEINARAYIKTLGREEIVTLYLPLRPVRSAGELRRDFEVLEARTEDGIRSAEAGALFGGGRSKRLKERISACKEMLNSPDPDRPAIQDCMDEIGGLLAELTPGWSPDPARDDFDSRVKKAWDLHTSLSKALPEVGSEGFDKQMEAIVREAEDAYSVRDAARWKQGWDRLGRLMSTMRDRNSSPTSQITPTQLKLMCHQELKDLENSAQQYKRYDENAAEFDDLRDSLEAIKLSEANAMDQLFGWYEQRLQPLTSRLQKLSVPIDDEGRPNRPHIVERWDTDALSPVLSPESNLPKRETQPLNAPPRKIAEPEAAPDRRSTLPLYPPEQVQFTAYRPKQLVAGTWSPFLVFAHLDDKPPGSPADKLSPIEEVRHQAERLLGDAAATYTDKTKDSRYEVPREVEITLRPEVAGVRFNPPVRSFFWTEGVDVHREEFSILADPDKVGRVLSGNLTIFLGSLILADIRLDFPIVSTPDPRAVEQPLAPAPATPFRRVFPSYSRRDLQVVEQIELYSKTLGDDYLRDLVSIRPGEEWNPRLQELIAQADVFQLFWSSNSANSRFVEEEWRFAAGLRRPYFIRPTYWEDPIPDPPDELAAIHFQKLWIRPYADTSNEQLRSSQVQGEADPLSITRPLGTKTSPLAKSALPRDVALKPETVRVTLRGASDSAGPLRDPAAEINEDRTLLIRSQKSPAPNDAGQGGNISVPLAKAPSAEARGLPQVTVKLERTEAMILPSPGRPAYSSCAVYEDEWEEEYEEEFRFIPKRPDVCAYALSLSFASAFLTWIFTNRTDYLFSSQAGIAFSSPVISTDTFIRGIMAGASLLVAWIASIAAFWLLNRFFGRIIVVIVGLFTLLISLILVIYFCLK